MKAFFFTVSILISSLAVAGDYDLLGNQVVTYKAANPEQILFKTVANLKSIFDKYKVQTDSSSRITSPLRVAGTAINPTMQVGIQKCVLFICKDVDLNAIMAIQEVRGSCQRTFTLVVDLSKSRGVLIDNYDRLDVGICYNAKDQDAQIAVQVNAHHAKTYQPGEVQNEVYKLLKIQIPALADALSKTLIENGASGLRSVQR